MATYKSVAEARRTMRELKQKIAEIINEDLEPLDPKLRTVEFWFSTVGKLREYQEKRYILHNLEKAYRDAETHILYAKSTSISKERFADTCS